MTLTHDSHPAPLSPPLEDWSILTLELQRSTTRDLIFHGASTIGAIEAASDQALMLMGKLELEEAQRIRNKVLALRIREPDDPGRVAVPDVLKNVQIREAGFSTRATNVLAAHGCRVLGHLVGITHQTLMALPNLGSRSAGEVLESLRRLASAADDAGFAFADGARPAPGRRPLPDVPEGCWSWTPRSCKPLEARQALFEEMEVESLGEILTTLSEKVDWQPGARLQSDYHELVEFLTTVARCAEAGTLMQRDGDYVAPQTELLAIHTAIAGCTSADDEVDALLRTESPSNRDSVVRRWSKREGKHEKLDEIGASRGVSRERIRQVTERPKVRLLDAALRLPRLSEAITELASERSHWTVPQAHDFLTGRGHQASEQTLRLSPMLASLGVVPWIDVDAHDLIVVEAPSADAAGHDEIPPEAKSVLARFRQSGWVDESLLESDSAIERIVTRRLSPTVRQLDRIGGAVLPTPGLDVSCIRWVIKVLHLTGAVPLDALHERMKRFEEHSYGQRLAIAFPSAEAFEGMLRRDSRFRFSGDLVSLRPELDGDDPLTPTERAVIGVIESLGGTASWSQIIELTGAAGHAQSTVGLAVQGPIVDKLAHGMYGLPGGISELDHSKTDDFSLILTNIEASDILHPVANEPADIEPNSEPSRPPSPDAEATYRRQDNPMAAPIPASERGTLTLPAVALTQDRHRIFLTAIRAEDLQDYTRIDHFKPELQVNDPKQGYQRTEDSPRVKKLGNWLRKQLDESRGVLMPTAILTSTRDAKLTYDPERRSVTLHKDAKLWVVDGQHRRAGLNYAIHEKGRDDLRSFEVPLVIVEDLSREQEMTQFAVVNGNQKGVRTDLVNMILTQLTSSRGDDAIEERDQWRVVVSRTVTTLNQTAGGPWEDLIVMPNEKAWTDKEIAADPSLEHQRVVRATSFMTSLRPIYDYLNAGFFAAEELSTAQRAERMATIVSAFWEAIRDLNPEPFEEAGSYVLQKTPGAFALHRLCARLLPVMHLARREWDRENFRLMLEPISEMSDPKYWDAKSGEASKYGSMKGFAELAENLWESRKSGI